MSLEVTVEWGGGKWSKGRRDHVLPIVSDATDTALIGIEEFNLSSHDPLKTATVFTTVNGFKDAGACLNAKSFELYFPYRSIKHRKVDQIASQLPGTVLHELAHCLRFERYPQATLVEAIATEGIAYVLEDEFNHLTLGEKNFSIYEQLPEIPPIGMNKLLEELGRTGFQDIDVNELTDPEFQHWESPLEDYSFASRVDIIGINAVSTLRRRGVPFAELIEMPATLIIDTGSQIAA